MKKYIFQFVVTLFAITSFTLVACSDDDDDPTNNNGRNSIEINGVSYNLSAFSCKKRSRLLQQKRRCCYSSDVAKLMFSS